MKRNDRDTYTLTSGREINVHGGIIGIDEAGSVFAGFDDGIEEAEYPKLWAEGVAKDEPPLTPAERAEIATEMSRRWVNWGWPTGKGEQLAALAAKVAAPGYCGQCDDGRPHTCTGGR